MKLGVKKINRPKYWSSLGDQYEVHLEGQYDTRLFADSLKEKINELDLYSKYFELKDVDSFLPYSAQQGAFSLPTSVRQIDFDLDIFFKYPELPKEITAFEKPTIKLYNRLRELQEEFKSNRCFEILAQIKKLVQELRAITLRKLSQTGSYIRSLQRILLYGYKPNRITSFRKVIQFLFKNMDDESDDPLLTHTVIVSKSFNRSKQKFTCHLKNALWLT